MRLDCLLSMCWYYSSKRRKELCCNLFAVSFVYKSMRMLFVICVCRSSSCHNLAGALLCHFSLLHHSTRPLHCSSPARSKQAKG